MLFYQRTGRLRTPAILCARHALRCGLRSTGKSFAAMQTDLCPSSRCAISTCIVHKCQLRFQALYLASEDREDCALHTFSPWHTSSGDSRRRLQR